jgi:hypothetical protein
LPCIRSLPMLPAQAASAAQTTLRGMTMVLTIDQYCPTSDSVLQSCAVWRLWLCAHECLIGGTSA